MATAALANSGAYAQSLPASAPAANASLGIPNACLQPSRLGPEGDQILRAVADHRSASALDALGAEFMQAGRDDCAIDAFKASLKLDPNVWKTHHHLALAYAKAGSFDLAAVEFRAVLREQPDSFLAHNGLGLSLERLGHLDEAVEQFKTATDLKPDFAYGWLNLAEVSLQLKRYPATEFYLSKALAMTPPEAVARRMRLDLGVAYSESGDYAKAADVFTQLIAEEPNSAQAHFDFATSLAHELRYDQAAEEYKRAWQLDPANSEAQLSMLKAMLLTDHADAALPFADQYVSSHPRDPAGYSVQGQLLRKLGRDKDALTPLRRAVELNPANYDARYNLGLVLSHLGSTQEAIDQLKHAMQLHPGSSEVAYALGMLYAKQKNQPEAREYLQAVQQSKAIKDNKERAGVLNNQANAQLQAGHFDQAAETYKQALGLDPDNAQWHYNYALALAGLGDVPGEQRELLRALALDPNSAKDYNQYGLSLEKSKRLSEAEAAFKKALDLSPAYAEAQNNLGILYAQQGKGTAAVDMLQKAILENPTYTDAYVNLGIVYGSQGKLLDGSQAFQKALDLAPKRADIYAGLAQIKVQEGHLDQAIPLFRKAAELQPNSASAHINLGVALADSWDVSAALEQFQQAVQLDPASPDAHYHLGRVLAKVDRLNEARRELEIACRLRPDSPSAAYSLALVARKQGDLALSSDLLRKVINIAPKYPGAESALARNLAESGKQAEAVAHWKLALKIDPNDADALFGLAHALRKTDPAESARDLARLHERQKDQEVLDRIRTLGNLGIKSADSKDWTNAIAAYKEALRLCGDCTLSEALHKNLGLIYGHEGDASHAGTELREALKLNPNDPDALQAMGALGLAQR